MINNMNFYKCRLFNGKCYITIQNKHLDGNKHCGETKDIFISQIKIPFTDYAIVLRKKGVTRFSDYGIKRIKSLFGQYNYKIKYFEVIRLNKTKYSQNDIFYLLDHIWMLDPKYDFVCCQNPQVLFSRKLHKYAGYSHRGFGLFGIGDMLFDIKNENEEYYYKNRQFRIEYVNVLYKHIDDIDRFEDLLTDGIKSIVPFNCRGNKQIDDMHDAYQAASNFAKYLS